MSKLLVTPTRTPKPLIANAIVALREAPEWQGVLAYDEFALTTKALLPPPWLRGTNGLWTEKRWTDREDVLATSWFQHQKIGITVSVAAQAIETVAKDAAFHPIRDYLDGLEWDNTARIASFAATYLGAEATPYHAAVVRCLFIAAVARIMEPGCKVDSVPIFEGPQGLLKSTAIEALFSPWFTDDLAELGTKDAAMQVRCAWGVEIAELSSMQRGEVERMKAFVSRRIDRFRPSYGRRVIEVHRQSVFIGSTNSEAYLKDDTGARRFYPLKCGAIDIAGIRRDRDQLWAEAVALYCQDVKWWFTDRQDVEAARQEQEARRLPDAWEGPIAAFIDGKPDVTVSEILSEVFFIEKGKWAPSDQSRVVRCLVALGWKRGWRHAERCYRPGP